jgi:hypothetical protein
VDGVPAFLAWLLLPVDLLTVYLKRRAAVGRYQLRLLCTCGMTRVCKETRNGRAHSVPLCGVVLHHDVAEGSNVGELPFASNARCGLRACARRGTCAWRQDQHPSPLLLRPPRHRTPCNSAAFLGAAVLRNRLRGVRFPACHRDSLPLSVPVRHPPPAKSPPSSL